MISSEAPILFSKACELFVLDLTMRAWAHTETGNRRTLQRSDVAEAIADSEAFDFLLDLVPKDESAAGLVTGEAIRIIHQNNTEKLKSEPNNTAS